MAVEIGNLFDGSLVSKNHIHRFLHAEPTHVKDDIIWNSAFHDHVCSHRPVVWGFLCLMCSSEHTSLSEEAGEAPSANLPYSTTLSRATIRTIPKFFYCVSGIVPFVLFAQSSSSFLPSL